MPIHRSRPSPPARGGFCRYPSTSDAAIVNLGHTIYCFCRLLAVVSIGFPLLRVRLCFARRAVIVGSLACRGKTNFFTLTFSGRMSNNKDMGKKLEPPAVLGNLEEHQREYIRDRLAELFTCVVRKQLQNKPANSRCRLRRYHWPPRLCLQGLLLAPRRRPGPIGWRSFLMRMSVVDATGRLAGLTCCA